MPAFAGVTVDLDPDRTLALSYIPAARREAVQALWQLDVVLGNVLAGGREPLISQIKLAWWREALEKLDCERAPSEPVLLALAEHVLTGGIRGVELAEMEEGWSLLLAPDLLGEVELGRYAAARGGVLFRLTARLLGGDPPDPAAGEAWALADLARHSSSPGDVEAALAAARRTPAPRWPSRLRPLGMLDALARRDCEPGRPRWEPQGSPRRMLRMLRHRLSGL
jgi:phytoene synthase